MPVRTATHLRVVHERDSARADRDGWRRAANGARADAERSDEVLAVSMRAILDLHRLGPDDRTCLGCGEVSPCATSLLLPADQPDVAAAWHAFNTRHDSTTDGGTHAAPRE